MNTTFKVKQSIYYEKKCNAPVIAWKNKKGFLNKNSSNAALLMHPNNSIVHLFSSLVLIILSLALNALKKPI